MQEPCLELLRRAYGGDVEYHSAAVPRIPGLAWPAQPDPVIRGILEAKCSPNDPEPKQFDKSATLSPGEITSNQAADALIYVPFRRNTEMENEVGLDSDYDKGVCDCSFRYDCDWRSGVRFTYLRLRERR